MKISARSQLKGNVKSVTMGVVTSEVVVELPGGQEVVAVITLDSAQSLNLKVGDEVIAIIKSTDVMIGTE